MRSRIAVVTMLVLGFLISGAGAAVAVSGISGAGSAAQHEYPVNNTGGQQGVLGESGSGGRGNGDQAGTAQGNQAAAQAAGQVAVTGGEGGLAFTGFAAITLLLVGVGLVGVGLLLRRAAAGD